MMDKTKEEFVIWIRTALRDRKSKPADELYDFMVHCFIRADPGLIGRVYLENLDSLLEQVTKMPRKHGFLPETVELYPTLKERAEAREKLFNKLDTENKGYIALNQWIGYCNEQIFSKLLDVMPKDHLNAPATDVSKEEFINFCKKSVIRGTPEYRELYCFLLKTFKDGDENNDGEINAIEFDGMIEAAAFAPLRYALAPADLYPTIEARRAQRKIYFETMDTDRSGTISFDEWHKYAIAHITRKASAF